LIEQQYPSGRKVKNVLDSSGDLTLVQSSKDTNSGYWNYASSFTYNPAGAVTSMQLGNGRWESTTFNSRLQPTQIALGAIPGATNLLDLDYSYGTTENNGNVMSHSITVPGLTHSFLQAYSYDSLNRIANAIETNNSTQTWKQTFTYDRYGNRRFDEANTTMPTSFTNQALTNPTISTSNNRLISTGWEYDPSGNTTGDPNGRQFIYDAENKQVKVLDDEEEKIGEYWYDGDGKRVRKHVPATGEVTVFVYDAAGKLIAEYSTIVESTNDSKVAYLTNDHLGSPRFNTDTNGAITSRHDYHPFGEETATSQRTTGLGYIDDTVRKQFTGYERDNESELNYAINRYQSASHGRFTSPDPLGGIASNPQTLNKYVYVINNPLNYVDPLGLECKDADRDGDSDACVWVSNGKGLYSSMWQSQFKEGNDLFNQGYTIVTDPSAVEPFKLNYLGNSENSSDANDPEYQTLRGSLVVLGDNGRFISYDHEVIAVESEGPSDRVPGSSWRANQLSVGPVSFIDSQDYYYGQPGQRYFGAALGVGIPRAGVATVGGTGTTNSGLVAGGGGCFAICGGFATTLIDTNWESHPLYTISPAVGWGTPQAAIGLGLVLPVNPPAASRYPPHIERQLKRYHPGYYRGRY
jgi:RHS repeat-associated protein